MSNSFKMQQSKPVSNTPSNFPRPIKNTLLELREILLGTKKPLSDQTNARKGRPSKFLPAIASSILETDIITLVEEGIVYKPADREKLRKHLAQYNIAASFITTFPRQLTGYKRLLNVRNTFLR